MLHSKRFLGLLVLATSCGFAAQSVACSDDDSGGTSTPDSGAPDTSTGTDGATEDAADAADAKPPVVFLDSTDYADLITIDASFPYGVTARHAADATIGFGVKWGTTGPVVTSFPLVTSWTIPTDPKGAATAANATAATTGTPDAGDTGPFWGPDGFVALPFGPFSLQSYTTADAVASGEALLYAPSFTSIVSRAFTNSFYSGVGIQDGATNAIIYSGFSPLAAAASATSEPGLYAAPLCNGQLLPSGNTCAASHKLFGWAGSSGPVVADTLGNVFVAASFYPTKGDLYALSKTQALATGTVTQATLAEDAVLKGTASEAAIAEPGASGGWLVAIGYPPMGGAVPAAYGVDYTSAAAGVTKGAHAFAPVVTPTATVTNLALFSDPNGHLWLAITTETTGAFLELQKKP